MIPNGFELTQQGAEAKLYRGKFLGRKCVLKERFQKKYRLEQLDCVINKERVKAEARALLRSKYAGVCSPAVYFVDIKQGVIIMEDVEGETAKQAINNLQQSNNQVELDSLTRQIGEAIGRLHSDNLIHGDLTTSNMIVKSVVTSKEYECWTEQTDTANKDSDSTSNENSQTEKKECDVSKEEDDCSTKVVMIDFGLSHVSSSAEDKAVDLYVLERALVSTHPNSEILFDQIVESYKSFYKNGSKQVMTKFEEVRARGRKRTMVG